MAENVIQPPPVPGFSAAQYAEAIRKASEAEAKLSDLAARLEKMESEATAKASEAAKKAQEDAKKATADKMSELEAAAQKAQATALAAFRGQHISGLKDPSYAALVPEVKINEDGTGLTEESVTQLTEWKTAHPELFGESKETPKSTGTTPAPGARSEGLSADMIRNLAMAGVDPTKAQESASKSPLGGLLGWGDQNHG